jgi:hypothetical protein
MGRLADAIRANIMEKYLSSYMREKNVDALFVLRNENRWTLTGKCFIIFVFYIGVDYEADRFFLENFLLMYSG